MSDLEKPIIRVLGTPADFLRKTGGGKAKPPLEPVTAKVRDRLIAELEVAKQALPLAGRRGRSAALIVKLKDEALAKSNRPNEFLESHGAPVVGAGRIGELISQVSPDSIAQLQRRIRDDGTKAGQFAISTVEHFAAWTAESVFGVDKEAKDAKIESTVAALREGKRVAIELFPWADTEEGPNETLASDLGGVVAIEQSLPIAGATILYARASTREQIVALASIPEVRHVSVEPEYRAPLGFTPQSFQLVTGSPLPAIVPPRDDAPVVGVFDTGINSPVLDAYVAGRVMYEVPPDTDHLHGTFVGGIIAASRSFNNGSDLFPIESARLLDSTVLSTGFVVEGDLLARIADSLNRFPDVRVWNCSFAAPVANQPPEFGQFARALDQLSDQKRVLFVIAAGNYGCKPARGWPAEIHHFPDDRVARPSESPRALTVGAISHLDCSVTSMSPASYSRRGPGPAYIVKPEVVHIGGGVNVDFETHNGIRSLIPGDQLAESAGTSFSTPIISCLAANAWKALEADGVPRDPALIKALVVHASALASPAYEPSNRNYYGYGMPKSSVASLFCDPSEFTMLFEVDLQPGHDWDKTPYPIPDALLTEDGRLRAEVIVSLCYSAPVSSAAGEEYLQHDVEASFGTYDIDPMDPSKRKHVGRIPQDRPVGSDTKEQALIAEALKYAPVKVYRKKFPEGCGGEQWRLKLSLTARKELANPSVQKAFVLVTLRSIDGDARVYSQGKAKIPATWVSTDLVARQSVRVRRAGP
ncbi:MAG TPA: S8 family peptidase [Lysobacter sp.]